MYSVYNRLILTYFIISMVCFHRITMTTFHDLRRLHAYLNERIDTDIRPIINQSNPIFVDFVPILTNLHGLDEKQQIFSSIFAMQLSWRYETLTWNSTEFGGAESVKMSSTSVWTPDITYSNALKEDTDLNRSKDKKVTISEQGIASWHTGANLQTACNVDIRKYPFDTQTCKIELGKTIYLDSQQRINSLTNKLVIKTKDENNEWLIADTNVKYMKPRSKLTYIEIYIVLERRYLFYVLNVIIPVVMLSMMNVFSFKLPSSSGERIGYNISLLLTYVVLLNMISDSVPKVSKYVSYLQLYIIVQFTMAILISIISITVVRIENEKYKTKMPKCLTRLFKMFLKEQDIKHKVNIGKDNDEGRQTEDYMDHAINARKEAMEKKTTESEDTTLIQFLDNFCFWTFMCFFVLSTAVCSIKMF